MNIEDLLSDELNFLLSNSEEKYIVEKELGKGGMGEMTIVFVFAGGYDSNCEGDMSW